MDPGQLTAEQVTALGGANVKVIIEVASTDGEVLAVPLAALFSDADGNTQVEVLGAEGADPVPARVDRVDGRGAGRGASWSPTARRSPSRQTPWPGFIGRGGSMNPLGHKTSDDAVAEPPDARSAVPGDRAVEQLYSIGPALFTHGSAAPHEAAVPREEGHGDGSDLEAASRPAVASESASGSGWAPGSVRRPPCAPGQPRACAQPWINVRPEVFG